jgi:hypothetical protein
MKLPKRIWHIIGIALITLTFSFIFIEKAFVDGKPQAIIILLIIISYLFSIFWRLYQYHKLDKLKTGLDKSDFVDYFDNLSLFKRFTLSVMPFPIMRKPQNDNENKIRINIIISIILTWGLFGLLLYFMPI